jgi:hypothetical protein
MRSADKTKLDCLAIWNKHKLAIENKTECSFNFSNGSSHTWNDKSKLQYIDKMILIIENSTDYD